MRLIYTNHAKKRMIERGISEKNIIETINLPDYTIKRDKEIEAYKKINDKNLKVVYIQRGKFINVITIYFL